MKSLSEICCSLLVRKLVVSVLLTLRATAQLSVVEPTVEIAETTNIDEILGAINDGADYTTSEMFVTRKFTASVPAATEAWIPLGVFVSAANHKLMINASGGFANSSLTCEFTVIWNQGQPKVLNLLQSDSHSQFQLYSYRANSGANVDKLIGLAIRYKNSNPNGVNTVSAVHVSSHESKWRVWDLTEFQTDIVDLDDASLAERVMKGSYEHHEVNGTTSNYGYKTGIQFNSPVTFDAGVTFPDGSITADALDETVFSDYLTTDNASQSFMPINGNGTIINGSYQAFAMDNSVVDGDFSIALSDSIVRGNNATAIANSFAVAEGATAIAFSTANGLIATAFGAGSASGIGATAIGGGAAVGDYATAFGGGAAVGDYATAFGGGSVAEGDYATAFGGARANADNSTAVGRTTASSYGSTTVGVYNAEVATTEGATAWQGDRQNSVLEVGIGTSNIDTKNALTVYQDGSCDIGHNATDGTAPLVVNSDGSVIISKAQGDISMGAFGL